jgi:hypothetical protein
MGSGVHVFDGTLEIQTAPNELMIGMMETAAEQSTYSTRAEPVESRSKGAVRRRSYPA